MEFFTAGISPPPPTPLLQSPVLEPQNTVPIVSVLDINEANHVSFSGVSSGKIAIITYVAKKRHEFPPSTGITTSWSVPRRAVLNYVSLVSTVEKLGLPKNSKFTIILPSGLQVHPSFWASHADSEDLVYIRFSPDRPVFLMPPPAYSPTPHHSIKVTIDGLWADGYDQDPQQLSVVCKSGTNLTAADIHSQVVDAANRIVTQCRYAVEPKGEKLVGFTMFVTGIGEVDIGTELDMEGVLDDGVEVQCTAVWS